LHRTPPAALPGGPAKRTVNSDGPGRSVWADEGQERIVDHGKTEDWLQKVPLFRGLSKKQLRDISGLATRLNEPAGTVLTKEGAIGREFIIVLEGEIEVRKGDRVVATRGPGDYVGEIALLDNRPRTATVVAKTPVVIEVIGQREFRSLLADAPELSGEIMTMMAQRLAELDDAERQ
jgi:CRP-like cAMP-binding protein